MLRLVLVAAGFFLAVSPASAGGVDADAVRRDVQKLLIVSASWARPQYGGFVVFEPDVADDEFRACEIRRRAPDALIMVDQEGGPVVRYKAPDAKPVPPTEAPRLGLDGYRREGARIAAGLRKRCVDVNLAPVVDPTSPRDRWQRSASYDPDEAGAYARAFADGLRDGGVLPTLKHFPGRLFVRYEKIASEDVTRTWELSHFIERFPGELDTVARQFSGEFPTLVMLSNNLYQNYGSGPAVLEPVFGDWVRRVAPARSLVISDALVNIRTSDQNIVRAFKNVDMLMTLDPETTKRAEDALVDAVLAGRVTGEELSGRLARAAEYVEMAKQRRIPTGE